MIIPVKGLGFIKINRFCKLLINIIKKGEVFKLLLSILGRDKPTLDF